MGFKCGIVGLPNVGKSTLFNALTQTAAAQAANYPFCTIEPNVGDVAVPDPRLEILCKIAGKPGWWLILFFIPFVNFVIVILVGLGLAQNFGKGGGFGVGIALLGFIFLPILAFDGSRYQGTLSTASL